MATDPNEPRALTAALQGPAFATRGGTLAMHVANRHVERWAPEAGATRVRSLQSLSFVDRMVAPWVEVAQRSTASTMRMFSPADHVAPAQRDSAPPSWVFPRPWYQDELNWMAAARQVQTQSETDAASAAPTMLTTRGTYVPPARTQAALPAALYEYVAPSLSIARPEVGTHAQDAYSSLIPVGTSQAAQMMSRAVAPLVGGPSGAAHMSPGLRAVLTTMIERSGRADAAPTRLAGVAPELVTPPAPRADTGSPAHEAEQLADRYAAQHAQIAELQRVARAVADRELAARAVATSQPPRDASIAASIDPSAERQRLEDRMRERATQTQRLHEQSRDAAARDARNAPAPTATRTPVEQPSVPVEIAAAMSALSPELTSYIGQRPDHAIQAIAELNEALRTVELLARNAASGGMIESTQGPRLVLPAGLGGLVATLARAPQPSSPISPSASALGAATLASPAALQHVAWADRWLARFAGAQPRALDVLTVSAARPESRLRALAAAAPDGVFVAPTSQAERTGAASSEPASFAQAAPLQRIDDSAETPDDVFLAIAAAASRSRAAAVTSPAKAPEPVAAPVVRQTMADALAQSTPFAPGAGLSAQLASSPFAPALRHVLPLGAAPMFDVRALFGGNVSASFLAGLLVPSTSEAQVAEGSRAADAGWQPTYVVPRGPEMERASGRWRAGSEAPLTTLHTALLSRVGGAPSAFGGLSASGGLFASGAPSGSPRAMVEGMALPVLGDAGSIRDPQQSWTSPGMTADRAQAWSVAQERSSSDLSFDFVTPELVLAARVYGLGATEAAQAARLAIAGAGQLTVMAGTVDRTFVQALAIDAEQRDRAGTTGEPAIGGGSQRPITAYPTGDAFGVERRAPRGAFLWPSATVGALGLVAAAPDGDQAMSVAALELLAARAVAELGTYAAFAGQRPGDQVGDSKGAGAGLGQILPTERESREPIERDVLASATQLVPSARRSKFEAMYLALGQTPAGRSVSPAARAARALAIAGRGDETITARERAAIAWDVMPQLVVAGSGDDHGQPLSTGAAAARDARRSIELASRTLVESRPGLRALSDRAGEALGSYVSPTVAPAQAHAQVRQQGAVLRAPTAAPELVRTGRSSGRHGGGEVDIPPWFETAARKMFEDRSGSTMSDGISLSDLTLVNATPPRAVAASTRSVPSAMAPSPVGAQPSKGAGEKLDVEKIANDVYQQILVLMDAARARNGEPYL